MSIFKNHFHHRHLEKYSKVFGTILNNMTVVRYDQNNVEQNRITVPVSFMPKEKFIQRLISDLNLDRQPAIVLPRMSYEITGLQYNANRKLNKNIRVYIRDKDQANAYQVSTPVPYDIQFNVYITTKTESDMLQIIEQLAPAFTPDFTFHMVGIDNPSLKFDVPITLLDIIPNDSYEGTFEENRVILWSMSFNMQAYLFGPIREGGLIKQVHIDVNNTDTLAQYATIDIEPFIDGVMLKDIGRDDDWVPKVDINEDFSNG